MTGTNFRDLANATVYDKSGAKIGNVKELYINDKTGEPDFIEVGQGFLGMSSALIPLRGYRLDGQDLYVAFTKDLVKGAPNVTDDAHLSPDDQVSIYRHYGLSGTPDMPTPPTPAVQPARPTPSPVPAPVPTPQPAPAQSSDEAATQAFQAPAPAAPPAPAQAAPAAAPAPTPVPTPPAAPESTPSVPAAQAGYQAPTWEAAADSPVAETPASSTDEGGVQPAAADLSWGDAARVAETIVDESATAPAPAPAQDAASNDDEPTELVRSEERLDITKNRVATTKARLRKYVVTEMKTIQVPVVREEIRLERIEISPEEAYNYNPSIGEDSVSITLHEDRVNVVKRSVPVEKIRLTAKQVEGTHVVSEELRKEEFDTSEIKGQED